MAPYPAHRTPSGRIAAALLLGGLLVLGYLVLRGFLVPVLWAAILAYVTWPLYRRLLHAVGGRRTVAALLMTLLLLLVIVLPMLLTTLSLREELEAALTWLGRALEGGVPTIPNWLLQAPWLGERLAALGQRLAAEPGLLADWATERADLWLGEAADALGAVGRNAVKFGLSLLAVFFFYRDGTRVVEEVQSGLLCLVGPDYRAYWDAAAGMTWAVVYGLILTALAQGALAGIGYWGAGVGAPVLLGAVTALFALVPFGAPVVWGSISLWLLWNGEVWAGLGLALWGALLVSFVDNLIRPLVISASTRIPFLLVLFGVLGGLRAFGLVGLFLGPVVLAILLAVWRHWLDRHRGECEG